MGGIDIRRVGAVLLPGEGHQIVEGRPVVGVLGRNSFANLQVLVDMPHGQVAYLTISDMGSCHDVVRMLMGPDVNSVSTNDDFEIPISINGRKHWAHLDMNLSITAVPSA